MPVLLDEPVEVDDFDGLEESVLLDDSDDFGEESPPDFVDESDPDELEDSVAPDEELPDEPEPDPLRLSVL